MLGSKMTPPLLIGESIRHAAKYHGDSEIVMRKTRGAWAGRDGGAQEADRARRAAGRKAMDLGAIFEVGLT